MSLLICILFTYICYRMAESRNRDVILAALLGAIFGPIAIIGYWLAGDKY